MMPQAAISLESIASICKAMGVPSPRPEIFASAEAMELLQQEARPGDITTMVGGYEIRVSPILPVEVKYNACDVETRREIKIPSGEWIHFIAIAPTRIDEAPLNIWGYVSNY
jgi:hypothetical protein